VSTIAVPEASAVSPRQLWSSFAAAEWIKIRTVRSTFITLAVSVVVAVGFGALACQRLVAQIAGLSSAGDRGNYLQGIDVTSRSLIGNAFAQLLIGALGVLVVTSEFGTGMIRASVIAMPQRQRWIAAKLAVFAAVVLVAGQILTFASFGIGQAILRTQHVGVSIGDPGVLRSVVATGLYIALIGLIGASLGLIIRHTAGALTSLIGIVFVLPALASAFSEPLQGQIVRLLPESIGEQSSSVLRVSDRFPIWGGIALMLVYATVLYTLGAVLLHRRDA
jgi:ABC-2 type transport system permease protein